MTQVLAIAEDIATPQQVEDKLGIVLADEPEFFTEWLAELPELEEIERSRLDQIRRNYLYSLATGAGLYGG